MDPSPDMSTMTNHTTEQVAAHESKLVTIYNNTDNEVAQNESQQKTQTKNTSMSKCCKALQNIFAGRAGNAAAAAVLLGFLMST